MLLKGCFCNSMERVVEGRGTIGWHLILSFIGENDTRCAQWKTAKYPMLECERKRMYARPEERDDKEV